MSHEWHLPRLQQRLEYLQMDSAESQGVWIDSPSFEHPGDTISRPRKPFCPCVRSPNVAFSLSFLSFSIIFPMFLIT